MDIKLFDSELKVMDVLWKEGDRPAKEIAKSLTQSLGWNVNTTYTLIKRCMKKGAIQRTDPGFLCHALIPKEAVQEAETARREAASEIRAARREGERKLAEAQRSLQESEKERCEVQERLKKLTAAAAQAGAAGAGHRRFGRKR